MMPTRFSAKNREKTMLYSKLFRAARANLLRVSQETAPKINDISENKNGSPIEINGLIINSKSNEK